MWEVTPPFSKLEEAIADPSSAIGMRMRAAYFLKQMHANADDPAIQENVVEVLSKGLLDKRHGSLMRHEFGYVMGQTRDEKCVEALEKILQDCDDCSMVRHESAEALAAIGAPRSRKVLEDTLENTEFNLPEVSETCLLALNVMDWRDRGGYDNPEEEAPVACACMLNPYSSVDPAPPNPAHANISIEELGNILCDEEISIFDRYRAMFSLRNRCGEEAVLQLCRALTADRSSALLRHEVAYVLGQLQHTASVTALEESLRRRDEHQMVRHESAEALGAIEGSWEKVEAILGEFAKDENQVVRESCLVALDAADYWGHSRNSEEGDEDSTEENKDASIPFVKLKAQEDKKATQSLLKEHFNVKT